MESWHYKYDERSMCFIETNVDENYSVIAFDLVLDILEIKNK